MRIVVLPGDGIGPEIAGATTNVLRAASARFQLDVKIEQHPVGHESLRQFGSTVQSGLLQIVRAADGLIDIPEEVAEVKEGDLVSFIPFTDFGILGR